MVEAYLYRLTILYLLYGLITSHAPHHRFS